MRRIELSFSAWPTATISARRTGASRRSSASCYLAIIQYLERQFGIGGRTSTVLGRLEWTTAPPASGTGPCVSVTVTVASGTTTIRAEERTGMTAGAIFGGVGGGVGGGAIMAPGALLFVNPVLGAVALPLWLGGIYVLCRRIYRRTMRRRVQRLDEAVHDIAEIIEDAAARAAIPAGVPGE